jgi:N-acetylmuramoyl-L-alanine amidase
VIEMKKLVLAAGHYLETPGKRTPDDIREWTLNNAVCNYIAEYLKNYNVKVYRVDDTTGKKAIVLSDRVKKTNKINPDAFVSIHHNAYNGKWNTATGTEVYHHTYGSEQDKALAKLLAPKISKETGLKNRGVKKASFEVLTCNANIPAVLCEGGFMDSKKDNPVITSEKGQRAYAKAVADGIIEFLKLEKKEEPKKLEIVAIEEMSIKLTTDANLWDLSFTKIAEAKAVKKYKKGDTVGNIVAIATHPCGSKYYMTEYSYKNKVNNGFNVADCEKYERRKCAYCGKYS